MQDAGSCDFDGTRAPEIPGSADCTELPSKRPPHLLGQTVGDAAVGRLCALMKHPIETIGSFCVLYDRTDKTNSVKVHTGTEDAAHGLWGGIERPERPAA